MTGLVFVDTNVFVYARDASEAVKQSLALEWLHELWATDQGRTSTQVLNEYYVTVTRKLSRPLEPDDAWTHVRALLSWDPQEITADLMLRAREIERRFSTSWWNALIVAAAEFQDCSVLLTEDLHDGMVFGSVAVRNPFTGRIADERVRYAANTPVSRHPARGRPPSSHGTRHR